MNLTTLLTKCSDALYDQNYDSWDKATLWRYIQESMYEFGTRTRLVKSTSYITAVVNQQEYDFPSDFISICRLGFGENNTPLSDMSGTSIDGYGFLREEYGYPQRVMVDETNFLKFKVWPIPDENAIKEPDYLATAAGMLGAAADTVVIPGDETFKSRSIIYNSDDSKYYRYLGSYQRGNLYTNPPRTGADLTLTFVASGTPSATEIEGLDHTNAATVWEEAVTKFKLDYYRHLTVPSVTDITSTAETNAITLDTGLPEVYWQKFHLFVNSIVLSTSEDQGDLAKSQLFAARAERELFGMVRKSLWRSARLKGFYPG